MSELSVKSSSSHPEALRRVQSTGSPGLSMTESGHSKQQRSSSGSKDADEMLHDHFGAIKLSPINRSQSAFELPITGATPLVPEVSGPADKVHTTILLVGSSQKAFSIPTDALTTKSPYFVNLAMFNNNAANTVIDLSAHHHSSPNPLSGPLSYPELDEFAVALFTRWLHNEHSLHGPQDFHSLHHYLGLYILARKLEIEQLQNQVMDLVRHYYHAESMTAPAFRVQYVYANTSGANMMRKFLVATAAYRVMSKGHSESHDEDENVKGTGMISESMKNTLRGGGDLAVDFVCKLIELSKDDMEDPRKGPDCL